MNLHHLVLLPNGQIREQSWAEMPPADHPDVQTFVERFGGLHCNTTVSIPQGQLRVSWKGSNSGAIGSFSLDDALFLCAILATGRDAEEDRTYLTAVGQHWNGSEMVRELLEVKPSPFLTLHEIADRPLLVSLLIPRIAPEVLVEIEGIELAVARAHFSALGMLTGPPVS